MTKSKKNRVELYGQGWMDGASCKPYPKPLRNPKLYLEGHYDGQQAFLAAMNKARKRFKEPLISFVED
jgi:hypothetical protein